MNIEEMIKRTAKATAREIVEQSKQKRQKDSQLGSFKKTERILYEYPHWQNMNEAERAAHLDRVLIRSYDMTLISLIEDGAPVSDDTFSARNDLIVSRA